MSEGVNIVIGAQDKASSVLDSVIAKIGGFAGSMGSLGPAAIAVGTAVAGAAAAFFTLQAAISGVSDAANEIDALVDKSIGLGVTVGDLQAFQFAMDEAGNVSAEGSIAALQKLQKVVGEVATGGDQKGMEVFKQLGLDAEELSMQNPIDQFMTVKEAIAGIENVSERAAVAQKILGKSAADLIPALISEQAAFEDSMRAAAELGGAVSDEGAAGIAAMNDALGRLGKGFEGIFNELAISVSPVVETIALSIADWLPPIIEMTREYLPVAIAQMAQMADLALEIPKRLGRGVTGDILGIFRNTKVEDTWLGSINKAIAAAEAQGAANREKASAINKAAVFVDEDAIKEVAKADEKRIEAAKKVMDELERKLAVEKTSEDAVKRMEQLAAATNDNERERIRYLQEQLQVMEKQKEVKKTLDDQQKKFIKGNSDVPIAQATQSRLMMGGRASPQATMAAEMKQSNKLLQDANRKQDDTNKKLDKLYEAAKGKSVYLEVAPNP